MKGMFLQECFFIKFNFLTKYIEVQTLRFFKDKVIIIHFQILILKKFTTSFLTTA